MHARQLPRRKPARTRPVLAAAMLFLFMFAFASTFAVEPANACRPGMDPTREQCR